MVVAQLWTIAAAAPDASPAQPDPGDPVSATFPWLGRSRGWITPVGRARCKLGIPSQYLRRVCDEHLDLLNHNVNTWLADEPTRRYLIRTLRGTGNQPGIARAMLSEKYKITTELDMLTPTALPFVPRTPHVRT